MKKNGDGKGIVELWGKDFDIVTKGLDEGQVVSFISGIIGERDVLAQRVEHLSALTKLAEKNVVESERLAEEIKKEATDQANSEADAIIAKAEEQAQQLIAEKRAEIIDIATKEAEAIKAEAEREAKSIIERQISRIQLELKDTAQRVYDQLQAQLENLKQQVVTLNAEFEERLSQPVEEAGMLVMGQESGVEYELNTEQQEGGEVPVGELGVSIESTAGDTESQQVTQAADTMNADETEVATPAPAENLDTATFNGQVELEILPPVNIMKIMKIVEYLDNLSETESTELVPLYDRPSIIVSLLEPLPLADMLRTLPEIKEAMEDTREGGTAGTDTASDGERKLRRIQITLSEEKSAANRPGEKATLGETKGR